MIDARRIELTAQPGFGLCWAACAHMLLQARGGAVPSLDDIVELARETSAGDIPQLEEHEITALFAKLGLRTVFHERALTRDELDATLDAHRPVVVVHGRIDTDEGHALVVAGRFEQQYRQLDPQRGERWVSFEELAMPRSDYAWAFTWELLAPPAP